MLSMLVDLDLHYSYILHAISMQEPLFPSLLHLSLLMSLTQLVSPRNRRRSCIFSSGRNNIHGRSAIEHRFAFCVLTQFLVPTSFFSNESCAAIKGQR